MAEVNINEITGGDDVDFDQAVDSDTLVAAAGGVVAGGNIEDSAVNTGRNDGILAGDDVDLDGSTVGDGNTQISDSTVGAFSGRGDATNLAGENVNAGSGDLTTVDTDGGDAQLVSGRGNEVTGDVELDAEGADGPVNFAVGDGNRLSSLEDNSTNVDDSFNTDNSVDDSGNLAIDDSFNTSTIDNDIVETHLDDSFNTTTEDNDLTKLDFEQSIEDNSVFEDNDDFQADVDVAQVDLDDADFNDLDA